MSINLKFIHGALQPAEELGIFATEEEYADTMLALAREATRRACLARERKLLVATFDVTALNEDATSDLVYSVAVQGERLPSDAVTTEIFPAPICSHAYSTDL